MKKILTLLAFIIPMIAHAQFALTPEGFKTEGDKNYYVVEINGTQSELFGKAKSSITQIFVSAKDAATFTEPDVISIHGSTDKITIKDGPRKVNLTMTYSINILFKDGKIRFNAPEVLSLYSFNKGREVNLYLGCGGGPGMNDFGHIFKKDGKIRNELAKESLDNYFNGLIKSIVDKMQNPIIDEDW